MLVWSDALVGSLTKLEFISAAHNESTCEAPHVRYSNAIRSCLSNANIECCPFSRPNSCLFLIDLPKVPQVT